MAATRLRYPKGYQFFDVNGLPLALAQLYYYQAGTTAALDTYANASGSVVNTNPLVLDGSGRLTSDVYLGAAHDYKEVLTVGGVALSPWPDDNIPAAVAVAASGAYSDLSGRPSLSNFTGDSGSGGAAGLVPAPSSWDSAAGKYLAAGGGWAVPQNAGLFSAHGASRVPYLVEELLTLSGASVTSTNKIPAGALVCGVSARTVTLITGATSYSVGVAGNATQFGSSLGVTAGSTNAGVIGPVGIYALTPIVITATGGNFTGGQVRIAINYDLLTPATS